MLRRSRARYRWCGVESGGASGGKAMAESFSNDRDLVAVVGHRDAEVARIASTIYEYDNLVVIAAGSTNRRLSRAGFQRVFRLTPTDEELGTALADYASGHALFAIEIIYVNDDHGRTVANAFESRLEGRRSVVMDRIAFEHDALAGIERRVGSMLKAHLDAILVSDDLPEAAKVISLLRKAGIAVPILCDEGAGSPDLARLADAEGVIVAIPSLPEQDHAFVEAYKKRYPDPAPGPWAAQGYDAIRVLGAAMIEAHSAAPEDVALALRRSEGFKTTGGGLHFDARGEPGAHDPLRPPPRRAPRGRLWGIWGRRRHRQHRDTLNSDGNGSPSGRQAGLPRR
jgi:branched-chain amino acid transport system substrate-binding protein